MNTDGIIQAAKDETHVKLLAIFSFILAGFSGLGLIFTGAHYLIMSTVFNNPAIREQMRAQAANQHQAAAPFDPQQFFHVFIWFYILFGLWSLVSLLANLLAGLALLRFRGRIFCIVVGALNCLSIPLGMVLGIFTIIVLMRDSVRARFVAGPLVAAAGAV